MRIGVVLVVAVLATASARADESPRNELTVGFEQSFVVADSPLQSWVDGGAGKLRYDESDDGLLAPRAFLEWSSRVTPTMQVHTTLNANGDGDARLGITEAYVELRPVPTSPWQRRWRVGAFYPHVSLENAAAGWRSPYLSSSSAINTWVGEELRTIGGELSLSRALSTDVPQRVGVQLALYGADDVAGGLLAARGWAIHDRQTALFESVRGVEPFHEFDDRIGYHAGADWRYGERVRVQAFHYDNLADPEAAAGGQYAWRTFFDAIGTALELPWDMGLVAQGMSGTTIVGPWVNGARAATDRFDAYFILATRAFGKHRATVRYDDFRLDHVTPPSGEAPLERGHAWTAGYSHAFTPRLDIAAEWMRIETRHDGWMGMWLFPAADESLTRVDLRWSFGPPR